MDVLHFLKKDELELAATVIGIVGSAFTALKAGFDYLQQHSLNLRRTKAVEGIDLTLKRFRTMAKEKPSFASSESADAYRLALTEDLEAQVAQLKQIRERTLQLDLRRKQDPKGVRKWLLLYKPEGVDGWISQTLFYFFALMGLFMVGLGAFLAVRRDSDAWYALLGFAFYSAIAVYFGPLSFRLKCIGNAQRRGDLGPLNSDLQGFKRIVVKPWGMPIRMFFYYLFLLETIVGPFIARSEQSSGTARADYVTTGFTVAFFFLIAEVLRADILARRGLKLAGFSIKH